MELIEIVEKLAGPIHATGSHSEDKTRLASLESLISLTEDIVVKIRQASVAANRPEESMRKIGRRADEFLCELASDLDQYR
jgi:hypothetical protein